MIDIRAELNEVRNNFISIYDFIYMTEKMTGENLLLVCQWILKRVKEYVTNKGDVLDICFINQFHEIQYKFERAVWGVPTTEGDPDFIFLSRKLNDVIGQGCLPIKPGFVPIEGNEWDDMDFFNLGFKKDELEIVFPEVINNAEVKLKDTHYSDNVPDLLDSHYNNVNSSLSSMPESVALAESVSQFSGKETALMLIAGLAIALEKTGERFKRGGKLNKSAVISAAEQAINTYGDGVSVTDRALRDWLNKAINGYASKLED